MALRPTARRGPGSRGTIQPKACQWPRASGRTRDRYGGWLPASTASAPEDGQRERPAPRGPRGPHRGPCRRSGHRPPAPRVPPLPHRRPLRGAAERPRAARARAAKGHSEGSTVAFTQAIHRGSSLPTLRAGGWGEVRKLTSSHCLGAHCFAAHVAQKERWVGNNPGRYRANSW